MNLENEGVSVTTVLKVIAIILAVVSHFYFVSAKVDKLEVKVENLATYYAILDSRQEEILKILRNIDNRLSRMEGKVERGSRN